MSIFPTTLESTLSKIPELGKSPHTTGAEKVKELLVDKNTCCSFSFRLLSFECIFKYEKEPQKRA